MNSWSFLLIKIVGNVSQALVRHEAQRRDIAHRRLILAQLQRQRAVLTQRETQRLRNTTDAIAQARMVSANPEWQAALDLVYTKLLNSPK